MLENEIYFFMFYILKTFIKQHAGHLEGRGQRNHFTPDPILGIFRGPPKNPD